MIQVGSFDAKTHFSEIIQKANQGEEYLITKKGKPMARILPPEGQKDKAAKSVKTILSIRKKYKMSHKEIKDLIREGRRY